MSVNPYGFLRSDIVKRANNILSKKNFRNYDFVLKDITFYDNREVYIIAFDQKDKVKKARFKGVIYLDMENLAFLAMDVSLSPKGTPYATYKIPFVYAKATDFRWRVSYRQINGKWYLNNSKLLFRGYVDIKKNLITRIILGKKLKGVKKKLHVPLEMENHFLITNIDKEGAKDFDKKKALNRSVELEDDVNEDVEGIWGKYNYIKPTKSMQRIIEELQKENKN